MSESAFDKIVRKTGRRPVGCKCEQCKNQCRRSPCLGTPDDIIKLIEAGFTDKLEVVEWATALFLGRVDYTIKIISVKRTSKGCMFFENGLCQLHDLGLKPTEGKLSHHTVKVDNYQFGKSLSWNVAKTWIGEENKDSVLKAFSLFYETRSIVQR